MDLYQAVKTDKCHSSPGRVQVNPDQEGAATRRIQVPARRHVIRLPSAAEHEHRSATEAAFCRVFRHFDNVIVASERF